MSDLVDEAVHHLRLSSSITDSKAQRAVNVVAEEIERLRGAQVNILSDPVAVHLNMLRGTIAKPSLQNIKHLYPEVQEAFAQVERLHEALGDLISDAEKQMRNPSHHMPFSMNKARDAYASCALPSTELP